MKVDRLDYYRNKLRGVPIADLGRAAWAILLEATREAEAEERKSIALFVQRDLCSSMDKYEIADEIRARATS